MSVQPGKDYTVRMYVHNNAASNLNLVAENVTAKFNLATTTGKSIDVQGFINSSNATPQEVYDHATFSSANDFNLAYVSGSLKYENNFFGANGVALPESIFTSTGAKLGYDKLDGRIPGCFQYAGYVTFTVKPQFAPVSEFTMSKLVSKHGDNKWVKNYAAQPGETVDYLIQYKNIGQAQQDAVTVRDTLPAGMSYVNGSTVFGNARYPSGTPASDNVANGTGINVGSYLAGANAWVIFNAKITDNDNLPTCGNNTLINTGKVTTGGGSITDTATVTVPKECKPTVAYTCDTLTIKRVDRTKFTFTIKYTINNATFKKVTYIVRDSKGNEVSRVDTTAAPYNYEQTKVGTYTAQAIVTFMVNGQEEIYMKGCAATFEVPSTPVYCTVPGKEYLPVDSPECVTTPPTTPPELPHTGAGSGVAAFLGLGSIIASIGYYINSRRALLGLK
jgi:uncharacterized repeat protein (TIGR01451 family)/LPXTG-motif cell wall-anchored protein